MSSHSRYDDRRYSSSSRRDSSRDSRRDRDSGRRSSPGPSRGRSPPPVRERDDDELPVEFGRPMELTSKEDENTVIKRMRTAFNHSPLQVLNECVRGGKKVKIWTRNFKEVRGICTGYVKAFDKHWNLVLTDVEEVFIKPKKPKTPFLMDVSNGDELPDLPAKKPKVKKPKTPEEEEEAKKKAEEAANKKAEEASKGGDKKKKKKKKGTKCERRLVSQLFVRGDNIVLCSVLEEQEGEENTETQSSEN